MEEIQMQEIKYYRQVKPPTLKQFVYRRAVREAMERVKGETGVTVNPETGIPIPLSALAAREALKGLTAEQILQEHPKWQDEYNEIYSRGGDHAREKDIHPG